MTNKQKSQQYSYIVTFFSCTGIFIMFIYSVIGLWWTLFVCVEVICLMFIIGAGKQNKAYDDAVNKEFEKFHQNYYKEEVGIDTGIVDTDGEINSQGKLIYF